MIELLKKMFEASPRRTTIEMKDRCSQYGKSVIISITQTSGGFGLNGGALFKNNAVSCLAKCPDCIGLSSKMNATEVKNKRHKVQTDKSKA